MGEQLLEEYRSKPLFLGNKMVFEFSPGRALGLIGLMNLSRVTYEYRLECSGGNVGR